MADKIIQETLNVAIDGKKIISNPFDFETMCIIQDKHMGGSKSGTYNMCYDAVLYLFEGKVTEKQIEALPLNMKCALCDKLWEIYYNTATEAREAAKNL